jgi:hypothetical protein
MKTKLLFSFLICLLIANYSNAQYSKILRNAITSVNEQEVQSLAHVLIQSAAAGDTITIPGGSANAGLLENTINGDTTKGIGRTNPNRVYKLQKNTIYIQHAGININNPTGILTIVGEKGGTKPVIVLTGVNGVDPGMDLVVGSVKLDNIHMQNMITNDGRTNDNLFVCSTLNHLPQSVSVNNCLFEFIQLDTFSCNGYTDGAIFKFTNSYFRNLFDPNEWWGGRVLECKQPIDTLWVENCTIQGAGMTFLQQSALCAFAYYNHNTIVNNNKYWQLGTYYLQGFWVNNIFINQNWVGEDYYNVVNGGTSPSTNMLNSNFDIDTLSSGPGMNQIRVQKQYLLASGMINQAQCGPSKMQLFISNNIMWTDTVMLAPYYHNINNKYGTDPNGKIVGAPLSFLNWTGPWTGPYQVVNVPCIWMNPRTAALFGINQTGNSISTRPYTNIISKDNYVNVQVNTVTPAIKDATVADQMGLWNATQWGVPGLATPDLQHTAYIMGDYDPTTIPGLDAQGNKTENGSGITKFTDLTENWSQTGIVKTSKIDGLPIGSLIWNDAQNVAYQAANSYVRLSSVFPGWIIEDVKQLNGLPESYSLAQNYPNPFNPTTTINFSIPKSGLVKLIIYNMLGQQIRTLVDKVVNIGNMSATWDGKDSRGMTVSSGIYLYRLTAGSFTAAHKMILLK